METFHYNFIGVIPLFPRTFLGLTDAGYLRGRHAARERNRRRGDGRAHDPGHSART